MEYNFREIEKKWQRHWKETDAYKVENNSAKPKFYVLDMFPYPSGAGLHVGHPLGYIASDIFARFKRLKGYNVLHPMGYDAFGLPAEQYAIEHGVHPAVSTEQNIQNFRKQLDNIGFSFDWDREVRTSAQSYYKWTQWIFLQLFKSFYNHQANRAENIDVLVASFEKEGNAVYLFPASATYQPASFTAEDWVNFDEAQQQEILMHYRLAYCGIGEVNWCEALGTVLANDEVVNGVSERGGYPVVKKKLRQWYLRITEYADRLLEGLGTVDFSDAMKEMQGNWIGKSSGAEMEFIITGHQQKLRVYTTRPDTIFGVDFMVVAPELEWVKDIVSTERQTDFDDYIAYVKSRSERERMAEKKITGCFTGAYAVNPFDGREIPIWISEYVLAGYGTGAIMAVPCGDERDFKFAKHFGIPITNIIGKYFNGEEANPTKDAILENSGFLNGMVMRQAIDVVCAKIEELGIGKRKVNYKMRDAAFSRQRYWGEPFPIVWKGGIAYPLDESELPLELPHVDKYGPGPEGEGPLANIPEWTLIPDPSPRVEKGDAKSMEKIEARGAANVPKYKVVTPMQYELAKSMRKGHTEAEKALWEQLRGTKVGVKFRRQHPIDAYIVDFIALQEKLVVEVDGGYHEDKGQKEYDDNRTKVLNEIGFAVIRFTNEEVLTNVYTVRDKIKEILIKEKVKINPDKLTKGAASAAPLSTRGEGSGVRETNTMPGYAGSSWYFLRYMDPHNNTEFCNRKASDYWGQVDLYIGGTEHAVGHLLYSRMWTKALYDLGYIGHDEPYKKLVNQGMIQGVSQLMTRLKTLFNELDENNYAISGFFESIPVYINNNKHYFNLKEATNNVFISADAIDLFKENVEWEDGSTLDMYGIDGYLIHVNIEYVNSNSLDMVRLSNDDKYPNVAFICAGGIYQNGFWIDFNNGRAKEFKTRPEVEKMSKSKYNVVNPDEIITKYGADTYRMYEMFLGPVEQSKPWDTKGIEGVYRFLRKLWRMFYDDIKGKVWTDGKATEAELKVLHRAIKKIEDDTERFSFNTAVSAFMVCVNELTDLKCNKKEVLEPLVIMLAPYAPHVAEELYFTLTGNYVWQNEGAALAAPLSTRGEGSGVRFPVFESKYLIESSKEYPISINGKLRTTIVMPLSLSKDEVQETVLANEVVVKWVEGKPVKNLIYVPNKMVNVVV